MSAADAAGDDATIEDGDRLLRRIPREWVVVDHGVERPASQAFQDHRNGAPMSIALEPVLLELGLPAAAVIQDQVRFRLAAITAGLARQCRQGIRRAPLPGDPSHGEVVGKKTGAVSRAFARNAVWVETQE
jgi:hypothetical protein